MGIICGPFPAMRGAWFQRCQALTWLDLVDFNRASSLASSASIPRSIEEHLPSASSIAPDHHPTLFHQHRPGQNSLSVTGSLPPPLSFAGIPCLYTSSLTSANAHRVLFILGRPGAGKDTQSERIVNTYKCVHLSVGDLLRTGAEKEDYPHANLAKECLVQGKNVPVELSLGLLRIAMDEKADKSDSEYGWRIFLVDGSSMNYDNVQGWMEYMPFH